eukprot:snap_masked-scaffold_13-processed-gene-3.26-mRNA-1 protein AED:1.00 eAED:1.00 QI:0/-1/0/0/-1/1/1/0/66
MTLFTPRLPLYRELFFRKEIIYVVVIFAGCAVHIDEDLSIDTELYLYGPGLNRTVLMKNLSHADIN